MFIRKKFWMAATAIFLLCLGGYLALSLSVSASAHRGGAGDALAAQTLDDTQAQDAPAGEQNKGTSGGYIGEAAAQELALTHAGIDAADVLKLETELDHENGTVIYQVKFKTGQEEGQYRIDALTGEVLRFQVETKGGEKEESSGKAEDEEKPEPAVDDTAYIGEAAAKEAALTHAGVSEGDTAYLKCYYKYGKGSPAYYGVEFAAGGTSYVYTVDLYTGEVLWTHTYPYHDHHHGH